MHAIYVCQKICNLLQSLHADADRLVGHTSATDVKNRYFVFDSYGEISEVNITQLCSGDL